jgi:hypothetical protein
MKMKIRYKIGIGVIVFFVSLYILGSVQAYRDWGFVCENTGSTKGHREWLFGNKTGHWYEKSALEDFMLEKYPDRIKHRWTSYAGTDKNIFGQAILYGHGKPGAILDTRIFLEDWVQKNNTSKHQTGANMVHEITDNPSDTMLRKIIEAWPELPDHIKQTIQTLVGSVTIGGNDNVSK